MIGRWSADLIEASGQAPRAQAEWMAAAKTALPHASTKPLQSGRRPWMEHPKKE
jgi:hypothetical protein